MRPSSEELLMSIAEALENRVCPAVQDRWAASTLRSASQLLRHLAVRVVREPAVLAEDNADACQVLQAIQARLTAAGLGELEAAIAAELQADSAGRDAATRNEGYQCLVERLLAARGTTDDLSADGDIQRSLAAYLQRRLTRERELYLPVFLGAPF